MLNYNSAINGETFSFVNLDKHPDWNLTRKELLSKFPMFIDFMKVHRCSLDELCDITYKLGIFDKNLFEYVTYNHYNSVLVARNAVYRTITERIGFNTRSVKKYSDVFIWQNTYAELRLADVATELIKKRFPFLLTPTFMKREKRFKDSINNLLLNEETKVNELDSLITL